MRTLDTYLGWEVTMDDKGTFHGKSGGHYVNSPSLSALKRKISKMVEATIPVDALRLWKIETYGQNHGHEEVAITGFRVHRGNPEIVIKHADGAESTFGRYGWHGGSYFWPNPDLLPLLEQKRELSEQIDALAATLHGINDRINESAVSYADVLNRVTREQEGGLGPRPTAGIMDWREEDD